MAPPQDVINNKPAFKFYFVSIKSRLAFLGILVKDKDLSVLVLNENLAIFWLDEPKWILVKLDLVYFCYVGLID